MRVSLLCSVASLLLANAAFAQGAVQCGIRPRFERFFQFDETDQRHKRPPAPGLAITHRFVEPCRLPLGDVRVTPSP